MKPVKVEIEEISGDEQVQENENFRGNGNEYKIIYKNKNSNVNNKYKRLFSIIFIILLFIVFFFFSFIVVKNTNKLKNANLIYINDKEINKFEIANISNFQKNDFLKNKNGIKNLINNSEVNIEPNKKIGLAFVYKNLYSNGIARFITLTANHLMETGRYDICFITSKPYIKEYSYNSKIKRFIVENNYALIRNISNNENIDFFILQNVISLSVINFYKSLGKKVIGMFHGVFMSSMTHGSVSGYRNWNNYDLFDSYVFIAPDDYYFYKKLGFVNEIYIPNLYTFEPLKTNNSNLTYNNIMMLGRENDPIKGAKYAVKTMSLIVKEIPNAKLTLITSDARVQFLRDLINKLNLTNNVFIKYHTYNISEHFLNSSIHMFTSLSEAFPLAMNEGKAHGLPIVAFDVPYSPPYQDGVIVVEQTDCEALAKETIKLLKDYNYRKKMGEYAKNSLNKYTNKETVNLWEKLFRSLLKESKEYYRNLQDEIEKKYYNEEKARLHLQKHFNSMIKLNINLRCHSFENFTDLNYIKNIKECEVNKSDSIKTL